MGILSGIFKARDKPTNATAGSGYRFLFGNSTSGKTVTERYAMQMTAVYSFMRESWQSTFGGIGNANKVAVLEEGMKYTPISISPEQAQFFRNEEIPYQ